MEPRTCFECQRHVLCWLAKNIDQLRHEAVRILDPGPSMELYKALAGACTMYHKMGGA